MSTIQVSNVNFESTANNSITYGANSITISAGGANAIFVNATSSSINNFSIGGNYISPFPTFRNKIINGDMRIDQRNAGNLISGAPTLSNTTDKWRLQYSNTSLKFNIGQVTGAPNSFVYASSIVVANSAAPVATDFSFLFHTIEGYNISDLAWGGPSAQTVTLSFWSQSNVVSSTFSGALRNVTGTMAYPFSYSIPASNTWIFNSVTIPGPTSGVWYSNSSQGIYLSFDLGSGINLRGTANTWQTNNFVGVTGATSITTGNGNFLYITGVQLEKGNQATPFEFRPYSVELGMCQRYYEKSQSMTVQPGASTGALGNAAIWFAGAIGQGFASGTYKYSVEKRAIPTVVFYDANGTVNKMSTFGSGIGWSNGSPIPLNLFIHTGSMAVDATLTGNTFVINFDLTIDADI